MKNKKDYFKICEDKYKNQISRKKPLIIRLDGRNICKRKDINLLDESTTAFSHCLKETSRFLSSKFNAIVYCSSDEINLIIDNPNYIIDLCNGDDVQKISSYISQIAFLKFFSLYSKPIFFDTRVFNVSNESKYKYLIKRNSSAKNVLFHYYAKTNEFKEILSQNLKLKEMKKMLLDINPNYKTLDNYFVEGSIFENGKEFKPTEYIKNLNIHFRIKGKNKEDKKRTNTFTTNDLGNDLDNDFDFSNLE